MTGGNCGRETLSIHAPLQRQQKTADGYVTSLKIRKYGLQKQNQSPPKTRKLKLNKALFKTSTSPQPVKIVNGKFLFKHNNFNVFVKRKYISCLQILEVPCYGDGGNLVQFVTEVVILFCRHMT